MATLYVTEYANMGQIGASAQTPQDPPLVEQVVAIGGASTPSVAFNPKTRLVRLHCDAICSVVMGTAPSATLTSARMAANQTEYRCVPEGGSFKVAVISNA